MDDKQAKVLENLTKLQTEHPDKGTGKMIQAMSAAPRPYNAEVKAEFACYTDTAIRGEAALGDPERPLIVRNGVHYTNSAEDARYLEGQGYTVERAHRQQTARSYLITRVPWHKEEKT